MVPETEQEILRKLRELEEKVDGLTESHRLLKQAYARSRAHLRRPWLRPPMWTYEQYAPRKLSINPRGPAPKLPASPIGIAIVTPSFNQGPFIRDTIESVLCQEYPTLHYHVQDGASIDDTVEILRSFGDRISWKSIRDEGQADAINLGFAGLDGDIMAYLNSDDTLLPGTLTYVADYFSRNPDVDIVYGHRIFIDSSGDEIGRAVFPQHGSNALKYAGYVPQETMFWRRKVWNAVGPMDVSFNYALDWDFMLRAQAAGFKFRRLSRFLACFRVHDAQKTTKLYELGRQEMQRLRLRSL